uniref:RRM domain-containing protein n=1 Tax=Peronospora matthiolae TaxID=2874970 RepID=A0AAV1TTN0_9STRA
MARVFVERLPEDVRERDLSDKFDRFGRIASVRIKFPARPPPFAFIVRSNT